MITPVFIALSMAAVRVTLAIPLAPIVSASGDLIPPSSHTGPIRPIFELPQARNVVDVEPASPRIVIGPGRLPSSSEAPVLIDREPQPGAIGPQFFGPGFLPDNVVSETPLPTFTGGPIGPQFFGPGFLPSVSTQEAASPTVSTSPENSALVDREPREHPVPAQYAGVAQRPRELHLGPLGLGGLGLAQGPSSDSAPDLGPLGLGGLGLAQGPSSVRRMVHVRVPTPDLLVSRDAIKIDVEAAQAAQAAEQATRLKQQQQDQALQSAQKELGTKGDPSILGQFQEDDSDSSAASIFQ